MPAFRVFCRDCRRAGSLDDAASHGHGDPENLGPFVFSTRDDAEAFAEAQVWLAGVEPMDYDPFGGA